MAVQKSFAMLAIVSSCLLPAVAAPSFPKGGDQRWIAEAFNVVLAKASVSHCSLIIFMDTSIPYFYEVLRSRVPATTIGWHVVFEVADDGRVDTNLTMTEVVAHARQVRLMSWCALVVVFSDSPTFLSAFADVIDNGRLMVWETRLLVVTRLPMPSLRGLLRNCWTFSMMNTMFLKIKRTGENHCQIYGHMPYSPNGAQVVQLASFKSGQDLVPIKDRTLFPEKYKNFHGMKINLTWIPQTPYFIPLKRPGPNGTEITSFTGREYWIMENIVPILNFSLNPLPYVGWDPVLKRLRTREAFLWPANLPILPHLLEHYDFSFFLERSTLAFAMAKPSIKPSWQSIYHPLRIEVWCLIPATVAVVYIVLMMEYQPYSLSSNYVRECTGGRFLDVTGKTCVGDVPGRGNDNW